jgi:hypothetical protein
VDCPIASAVRSGDSRFNLQTHKRVGCESTPALWLGPIVRCPLDHPVGEFAAGDTIAAVINASPHAGFPSALAKCIKRRSVARRTCCQRSTMACAADCSGDLRLRDNARLAGSDNLANPAKKKIG